MFACQNLIAIQKCVDPSSSGKSQGSGWHVERMIAPHAVKWERPAVLQKQGKPAAGSCLYEQDIPRACQSIAISVLLGRTGRTCGLLLGCIQLLLCCLYGV